MSISAEMSNSAGMSNSEAKYSMLNIKYFIHVFEIKQEVSVTGIQTLDNLYTMKEVDSQQTPLFKVDFSPVYS